MTGDHPPEPSRRERALFRGLRRVRVRHAEGLFLTSGVRAVTEVLDAGGSVHLGLASPRIHDTPAGAALHGRLASGAALRHTDDETMSRLAPTASHQGILLAATIPVRGLEDLRPGRGVVLVLDGVQDPGNVGTLIRSAVAFGVAAVITLDGTADPWGPKAVRAAAGMVLRLPVLRISRRALVDWAARRRIPIWGADSAGEDLAAAPMARPVILALGGEGEGVSPELRSAAARVVRVPMPGPAESLNVAMAGSVLLFECGRLIEGEG